LTLLFSLIILFKKYRFIILGKKEPVERRRILKFSGYLTLGSISFFIFGNIDKLLLGYFVSAELLGLYAAMLTIISGIIGILGFSGVFYPLFTQLKGNKFKKLYHKTQKYLILLGLPASIGLAYIFLPLMAALYGNEYVPIEYAFALRISSILISFVIIETLLSGFYKILFDSVEKPKIPAFINIFSALLNVILNIIFIITLIKIRPEYSLIGVAAATLISRSLALITLIIIAHKKLKISPDKKSILRILFISLLMLSYMLIFDYLIELNLILGILMSLTSALLYFALIILFKVIEKKELQYYLKSFLSKTN